MSEVIISPARNSDFREFLQTKPDLTDMLRWVQQNCSIDEVYDAELEYIEKLIDSEN